jgi:hypothetical protein
MYSDLFSTLYLIKEQRKPSVKILADYDKITLTEPIVLYSLDPSASSGLRIDTVKRGLSSNGSHQRGTKRSK